MMCFYKILWNVWDNLRLFIYYFIFCCMLYIYWILFLILLRCVVKYDKNKMNYKNCGKNISFSVIFVKWEFI